MVRRYRKQRRLKIVNEIVSSLAREPLKISFKNNPFYWALYAARNYGDIEILTYKDISRFAAQMMYADKHDIDPELIVGFIYQQGNETDLSRKLASGEKELWFKAYRSRRAAPAEKV